MIRNYFCCFAPAAGGRPRAVIEVTRRCNQRCRHCQVDAGAAAGEENLDWVPVLRELHGNGFAKVTFTGGEPLLYPGLLPAAHEARKLGLETELLSNLTLLTSLASTVRDEVIQTFDGFVTSLDGASRESHGYLRRDERSFDALLRALDLLAGRGKSAKVLSVVHPRNARELPAIAEQCAIHGVRTVLFIYPKIAGRLAQNRELVPDGAALREAMEDLRRLAQDAPLSIGLSRFPGLAFADMGECAAADRMVYISAEGNVHPCQHFFMRDPPSLLQEGFTSILRGERFEAVRRQMRATGETSCPFGGKCPRGCRPFGGDPGVHLPECDPDCVEIAGRRGTA